MFSKLFKLVAISSIMLFSNSVLSYNNIQYMDSEQVAVSKWIDDNSCNLKNKVNSNTLISNAYYSGKKYNVDPHLMIGLIRQESCFNHTAKSYAGAIGLTQVIPKWHKEKIKGRDLTIPYVSIEVGTMVVAEYLKSSNGDLRKALRKYSGGANNYYNKVIANVTLIKENIKRHRPIKGIMLTDNTINVTKYNSLDKWFKGDVKPYKSPVFPNVEHHGIIDIDRRNKHDVFIHMSLLVNNNDPLLQHT